MPVSRPLPAGGSDARCEADLRFALVRVKPFIANPIAVASIDHLRRYVELLFQLATRKRKETS
jgi:hypothetical protein